MMKINLTFETTLAMFGAMLLMAALPSVSVLTVTARTVAAGFSHGVVATLGIVVGDMVYILVAIFGLALLADVMGQLFVLIRCLGGIYLIWLGARMLVARNQPADIQSSARFSLPSSFFAGLMITLADHKAILFYLGFLPAFVDLARITGAKSL